MVSRRISSRKPLLDFNLPIEEQKWEKLSNRKLTQKFTGPIRCKEQMNKISNKWDQA
jgi:hypothetical protein